MNLHPEADDEMRSAANFYEIRQSGLGNRFLDSVAQLSSQSSQIRLPIGS
ncbi:MAG TPA: hypothetical protein VE863_20390 [Pyrinomonadaceae bacterium]|nr:hypothetical protein [Pyrinomonadaceae bacterium]